MDLANTLQIRYESNVSDQTAIKFMTDGILLREIGQDFLLKRYSVIIIDEAHERTVNTDILIGILSRLVDLRADLAKEDEVNKPLKLIIMSATLRVSDFLENKALFKRTIPSLISIEGRQYPVKEHFARKTGYDYVDDVYTKICRGHKKLPPGGMLVFLAGQDEIWALAKRLKNTFTASQGYDVKYPSVQTSATEGKICVSSILGYLRVSLLSSNTNCSSIRG